MSRGALLAASVFFTAIAAQPAVAQTPAGFRDDEMSRYRLTMEDLRKYASAKRNLDQVVRSNPQLQAAHSDATNGVMWAVPILDAHPPLARAVQQAGLSTNQFSIVNTVLFLARGASLMTEQRAQQFLRNMSIHPDNLVFYRTNKSQIEALGLR